MPSYYKKPLIQAFVLLTLAILNLVFPTKALAVCTIIAGTTCYNSNHCPSGQQECPGTDNGQSCTACRTTIAATEQTCSNPYSPLTGAGCSTGTHTDRVCKPDGTASAPCFTFVSCTQAGSNAQCSGLRGSTDEGCNYCVTPAPVLTLDFWLNNVAAPTSTTIKNGESATLTWSASLADTCTASGSPAGAWSGPRNISSGSVGEPVSPTNTGTTTVTYTYTLTCSTKAGASVSKSVSIAVRACTSTDCGVCTTCSSCVSQNLSKYSIIKSLCKQLQFLQKHLKR